MSNTTQLFVFQRNEGKENKRGAKPKLSYFSRSFASRKAAKKWMNKRNKNGTGFPLKLVSHIPPHKAPCMDK